MISKGLENFSYVADFEEARFCAFMAVLYSLFVDVRMGRIGGCL